MGGGGEDIIFWVIRAYVETHLIHQEGLLICHILVLLHLTMYEVLCFPGIISFNTLPAALFPRKCGLKAAQL